MFKLRLPVSLARGDLCNSGSSPYIRSITFRRQTGTFQVPSKTGSPSVLHASMCLSQFFDEKRKFDLPLEKKKDAQRSPYSFRRVGSDRQLKKCDSGVTTVTGNKTTQ